MGCKYFYNNTTYDNYKLLVEALSSEDIENALSIMYSLNIDKQNLMLDKIDSLNLNFKFKAGTSIIDSESDLDIDKNTYFTTQTFIDSAYFTVNGEAPMFRLNMEEYISTIKELMLKTEPEEKVNEYVSRIRNNWDKIAKDASDLHRIIVSSSSNDSDKHFSGSALNTAFAGIYDKLGLATKQVFKDIYANNKGGKLRRNINVAANIKGLTELIIGHIDYLMVKDNGDIEIFNLKASIESDVDWGAIKLEKFRYQLALLKRILEFNGIDSRNIRLNIIPIKLTYDSDFNEVIDISVSNARAIDTKNSQYIFLKYDNIAAQFINSKVSVEDIDDYTMNRVNSYLKAMFTGRDADIRMLGIKESAKSWAKHNWNTIATESSTIGWDIKFPEEENAIHINDTRIGAKNAELISLIQAREELLFRNSAREKLTYRIVSDILASFRHGQNFFSSSVEGTITNLINKQLAKYFDSTKEEGKDREYKWELIENDALTSANLIMFRHRVTNLVDLIDITPFDVSTKDETRRRKNLLGAYIPDRNDYGFMMESNYGNIEAVKTLTVLNEIIPKLSFKPRLGTLKVISATLNHVKHGIEYEMGLLIPEFNTIVNVVNKNNIGLNMPNNLKLALSIDPALLFIQTWKEVIHDNSNRNMADLQNLSDKISQKVLVDGTIVDGLETILSIEGKIEKLETIINTLKPIAEKAGLLLDIKSLTEALDDSKVEAIAKVYKSALYALNMYYGDIALNNEEFSRIAEEFSRPLSIPNSSVRIVAYMFQKAVDKIANTLINRYNPIRDIIMQYYKDCGYTALENSTIGNQTKVFKNLYATNPVTGEKTMKFKNPYNSSENLEVHERKFLKDILWELNKIRYELTGATWKFKSKEDPELIKIITSTNYLWVPLERASAATRRANLDKEFKNQAKRFLNKVMHPKDTLREVTEGIIDGEEFINRNSDMLTFLAHNPFLSSDKSITVRSNRIANKGVDYFETNVENIMIDFLEKHILASEFNKMLTRTKGVILALHLKGDTENDSKNIEHTIKTIEDFLSVSVYNKSIMENTSLVIESYLQPIRQAVTNCYIAGNVAGSIRDLFQGFLENTVRALTKFLTNIGVKDVMFGYLKVMGEGVTNLMSITKLNLLNLKWRISNLDVARISEGLKTGRGGIFNYENWMFATLRGPDYINRMVLLVAQMHKDGVYDAYKLENGKLIYDWRADKRFSDYVLGNKTSPKYNELRALYLSLLRLFNLENNTTLVEGDALPDAYTSSLITGFKNFSDNIYGSYNLSSRQKMEHGAIGRNFAVFSTWLNGIVDVYAKAPQLSKTETIWALARENGELLYFDLYGRVVLESDPTAVKETPVMEDVPIIVLGCLYTLKDFINACLDSKEGSLTVDFWTDPIQRRNINKMLTDLLVGFIIASLFKMGLDKAYNNHKKVAQGEEFVQNAIIELLYKGGSNCWDGFGGPVSIISYFGNSTNPATYKLSSKILKDGMQYLLGDKTTGELIIGALALPRSLKDTYELWLRDNTK